MNLKQRLIEAGCGTAMENKTTCSDHIEQCAVSEHKFCWRCGQKLEIVAICPWCKIRFASSKAYKYHLSLGARKHKPPACPICSGTTTACKKNNVPNALSFFCSHCHDTVLLQTDGVIRMS